MAARSGSNMNSTKMASGRNDADAGVGKARASKGNAYAQPAGAHRAGPRNKTQVVSSGGRGAPPKATTGSSSSTRVQHKPKNLPGNANRGDVRHGKHSGTGYSA